MSRLRTAAVAVLAVLALAVGVFLHVTGSSGPSYREALQADPKPVLFADSTLAPTRGWIDPAKARAAADVRAWFSAHGTGKDDAAFARWAAARVPAPPADLARQMPQVVALFKARTPAGTKAAGWLEAHGKKDLWKLAAHDQGELMSQHDADRLKGDEKSLLKLTKTIADQLGAKFGSSAPYVRMPSLRPDHHVAKGQKCPCSWPSRHAAVAAASTTFLGTLDPHRRPQYAWLQAEIDYSRVYMAGHFPGDISAGSYLGDLVGDYFLVTRGHLPPGDLSRRATR